jgi:hypothetical protein
VPVVAVPLVAAGTSPLAGWSAGAPGGADKERDVDDLIEALTIFRKYDNPPSPTHCEHDLLTVMVDPDQVSDDDIQTLDRLGFLPGDEGAFYSFRFGSA